MFKPENIFFVQGHGDTERSSSPLSDTAFGPALLEYDRFKLPENVFTVSSREVGLATEPSSEPAQHLKTRAHTLAIPDKTKDYKTYTKQLRDLGKDLFETLVWKDKILRELWEGKENEYRHRKKNNSLQIPHLLHTHGHKHTDYNSLAKDIQLRDSFLFSAPNDNLSLGSFMTRGSSPEWHISKNGFNFGIQKDFFVSGVAPLNELSKQKINTLDILLPKDFFNHPLNTWHDKTKNLSKDYQEAWKEIILEKTPYALASYYQGNKGFGQEIKDFLKFPFTPYQRALMSKNAPDEFCIKVVGHFIDALKSLYFWSTKYDTEADFLSKKTTEFMYSKSSKQVVEETLAKKQNNEPKLFIFYHCRSIGSDNTTYRKYFNEYEAVTKKPTLSRVLSTAAALGNQANMEGFSYNTIQQNIVKKEIDDLELKIYTIDGVYKKVMETVEQLQAGTYKQSKANLRLKKPMPTIEEQEAKLVELNKKKADIEDQILDKKARLLFMGGRRKIKLTRKQRKHRNNTTRRK